MVRVDRRVRQDVCRIAGSGVSDQWRRADNDLLARLGAEPSLGLSASELQALVGRPLDLVGSAEAQVQSFATRVEAIVQRYPQATTYVPGRLL